MKKVSYFDYAAATPVDKAVLAAMQPYYTDQFYNPSALYLASKAVRRDVEAARIAVATVLGARPSEIVFTAGGTESANLAICGVLDRYPEGNVVVSAIEHDAVMKPALAYSRKIAAVDEQGMVDLKQLEGCIDEATVLVSVIYANNEIGVVQHIKEIAELLETIKKRRQASGSSTPLLLHTDACQAANYLDLHVSRLGVDLMTLNGGKIYGPKQSGVLYCRAGVMLAPMIKGGGQEMGVRSGTENVAQCIGFAEALRLVMHRKEHQLERLQKLQKQLISVCEKHGARINGSLKHRLVNNVSATFAGYDNERLVMQLDELGILCAVGSACHAASGEKSTVLQAIGLEESLIDATVRFSIGRDTEEADILALDEALTQTFASYPQ